MTSMWNLFTGFISGMLLFWPTVLCLYIFYAIGIIGNKGGKTLRVGHWKWRAVLKTTLVLHLLSCGALIALALIVQDPVFDELGPIPLGLGLAGGTLAMYLIVNRRGTGVGA